MRAALVICCLGALLLLASPTASPADPGLCGVVPPIDPLLGCPAEGGSSSSSSSSGSASPGSGVTAAADLQTPRVVSEIPSYVPGVLLVKFKERTSPRAQQALLRQARASVERRIAGLGVVVVRVAPERREAVRARLAGSPLVASAERDAVVQVLDTAPNDPIWPDQWGLRTVALPAAWDRSRGSSSVIVAVVDTGVDAQHPDLAGAVLPGFDLVHGGTNPADDEGHGTAVAGVIAARTNNLDGTAGVCWSCSILPIKVLGADGTGDTALVAAGIVKAVDAGAHVVNLSLGGPADEQTLEDAVSYATRKGVIVVAAAGNNGTTTPFYPAAIPGVVSVAAIDPTNHAYSWSNYGWPNVAAPGCDDATMRGGGYVIFCGTSAATPVVSGVAALALALDPAGTRDQIVAALEQTAAPLGGVVGNGLVNAQAALASLPQPPPPPPPPAAPATLTVAAALRPAARPVSYPIQAAEGPATATLRFASGVRLTLAIRDGAGTAVSRSGRSPLQLTRQLTQGAATIEVSGARRRTPFTLTVSYVRPQPATSAAIGRAPSPNVRVSAIPPASGGPGPQVGAPPPATGAAAVSGLQTGVVEEGGLEATLLAAVNNLRKSRGLPALARSPLLARAALAHVRALGAAGRFDHAWDDGTPFAAWIVRYYPYPRAGSWLAGENLLWSSTPVDTAGAVAAWVRSPQHRRILLAPTWRELGIGAVAVDRAPGVYGNRSVQIVAADFGTRTGA
jgi:subtilisin family serine protease